MVLGKTFTMGTTGISLSEAKNEKSKTNGVTPRVIKDIFEQIDIYCDVGDFEFNVKVSFFEVCFVLYLIYIIK